MTEHNYDFRKKMQSSLWSRKWFELLLPEMVSAEIAVPFNEAFKAYDLELYLASSLCFLTGIETSLKITNIQLENIQSEKQALVDYKRYKKEKPGFAIALKEAKKKGVPIDSLFFPGEADKEYPRKIATLRDDLCHGNTIEFQDLLSWEDGIEGSEGNELGAVILASECFKKVSETLYGISVKYLKELMRFRREKIFNA